MSSSTPAIIRLVKDMTLRWSSRRGDFLLWIRWMNPLSGKALRIIDLWEMHDGDFITTTNRMADLPPWFELHPTEVCNALARQMMVKLRDGYQPGDPMDGPNIWRLKAGDYIAWVGHSRPDHQAVEGILAILDCQECALAIGESNRSGIDEIMTFGSPSTDELSADNVIRCRAAVQAVRQLGIPHTWGERWLLG